MEHTVDIPVPGRGGRSFWSSRFFFQDRVQQRRILAEERISERIVEQIVDIPVSGGGLQVFRPGQSSSSSLHVPSWYF